MSGLKSVLCSTISNSKKREEPTMTINGGLLYKLQFFYTMKYCVTLTKKTEALDTQRHAKIVKKEFSNIVGYKNQ